MLMVCLLAILKINTKSLISSQFVWGKFPSWHAMGARLVSYQALFVFHLLSYFIYVLRGKSYANIALKYEGVNKQRELFLRNQFINYCMYTSSWLSHPSIGFTYWCYRFSVKEAMFHSRYFAYGEMPSNSIALYSSNQKMSRFEWHLA